MRRAPILMVAIALAGCGEGNEPTAQVNAPEPEKVAPQRQVQLEPMILRGTEPSWSAEVVGASLTLTQPDVPPRKVDLEAPIFRTEQKGRAPAFGVTVIRTREGGTLTLRGLPCSDGMSDTAYPMSAELRIDSETFFSDRLKGCALYKNAPPKQP